MNDDNESNDNNDSNDDKDMNDNDDDSIDNSWARIACQLCVGLAVLLDATSWVWSSSGDNFSGPVEVILPMELTWVLTPFPQILWEESIN